MFILIIITILAAINAGIASIVYACSGTRRGYNPLYGDYMPEKKYSFYFHLSWLIFAVAAAITLYIHFSS